VVPELIQVLQRLAVLALARLRAAVLAWIGTVVGSEPGLACCSCTGIWPSSCVRAARNDAVCARDSHRAANTEFVLSALASLHVSVDDFAARIYQVDAGLIIRGVR
jgi:hypothetical protein